MSDKEKTAETSIAYNELLDENTKLKELLKQAKGSVWLERECDNSLGNTVWNETTKLLNEINEVLGEE